MKKLLRHCDIFAVVTFVAPFAVYLSTLAPSVTFFDSGEFITAIHSLGSAHSPGYPLFINFAKPFTWLPVGNIAFRVNIATAVSAALACLGVYLLVAVLHREGAPAKDGEGATITVKCAAMAAGLLFAFSPRLWLQSNHDKPYPLLASLVALALLLVIEWRGSFRDGNPRPGYLYLSALVCGLALGAHQSLVLALPMLAYLSLFKGRNVLVAGREVILAAASFLLGASIHLHLPVRAAVKPLLNWGDPSTLGRFLWHFLRKGYPVDPPDRDLELLSHQVSAFNIPREFTWVGLVLFLLGCIICIRANRDFIIAYFLAFFSFLLFVAGYLNTSLDQVYLTEEFFTPLYMLSAVVIGIALSFLAPAAVEAFRRIRFGRAAVPLAAGIMALAPAHSLVVNYLENDQRTNYLAFDYTVNTFRSLPQGAALFTWGDSGAFPLWYLQGVERMREDLDLLHIPHLSFGWYLDTLPGVFQGSTLRRIPTERVPIEDVLHVALREQSAKRPVFIDFSTRFSVSEALKGFSLRQRGICYRVIKGGAGDRLPPDTRVWDYYTLRGLFRDRTFIWDLDSVKAVQIYAYSHYDAGVKFLSLGLVPEAMHEMGRSFLLSSAIRD